MIPGFIRERAVMRVTHFKKSATFHLNFYSSSRFICSLISKLRFNLIDELGIVMLIIVKASLIALPFQNLLLIKSAAQGLSQRKKLFLKSHTMKSFRQIFEDFSG